jgi:hypothetical protein
MSHHNETLYLWLVQTTAYLKVKLRKNNEGNLTLRLLTY